MKGRGKTNWKKCCVLFNYTDIQSLTKTHKFFNFDFQNSICTYTEVIMYNLLTDIETSI